MDDTPTTLEQPIDIKSTPVVLFRNRLRRKYDNH